MSDYVVGKRPDSADYKAILLSGVPLIDVRAPVEFQQGAFPSSINLPLMLDNEREEVGICYKQAGQEAAIALGNTLVRGEVKAQRLAAWIEQCQQAAEGYLYCFRGGLRSHLVQEWLQAEGIHYPLVIGGYKALRHFLLSLFSEVAQQPMVVVGGNTGCGKTRLLQELDNSIDLEGFAHHRGSSFGRTLQAQPSQINFENTLAIRLLQCGERGINHWVLEDEGCNIGAIHLPIPIYEGMQKSPMVVIDDPLENRLQRLLEEYVEQMQEGFIQLYGQEQGWQEFASYLHQSLFAIRKRLGLERYQIILRLQEEALQQQMNTGDKTGHFIWLQALLRDYYDPMYSYQLSQKGERLIFRGDYSAVRDFLQARSQ